MNKSGIKPVGLSLVIEPEQVQEKTESGIVLGTPEQLEREQLRQTDGVVLAIGPIAFYDERDGRGDVIPRCKVGDRIVMKAYAGMMRKGTNGLAYRIIADSDVIGVLETNDE